MRRRNCTDPSFCKQYPLLRTMLLIEGVVREWMLTWEDEGARLLNRNWMCSLARGEVNPAVGLASRIPLPCQQPECGRETSTSRLNVNGTTAWLISHQ
jgi:hypothetical protein